MHKNDDYGYHGKRIANQSWTEYEDSKEEEYVWQKGQWCPPGLRKSQKRRVQRLRNRELQQKKSGKVWRVKHSDKEKAVADVGMVFILPAEFMAPKYQEVYSNFDESEFKELSTMLTLTQQAVFDKPERYR